MLATLLFAGGASASIVNVLTPTIGPPEAGSTGEVALGVSGASGNEDTLGFSGGVGGAWVSPEVNHQVIVKATGAYATAYGAPITQKAFSHVRYRWAFHPPWILFTFAQADHNAFRDLELRAIGGGGMERRLWRADWTEATVGLGAFAEYERFIAAPDSQQVFGRASAFYLVAVELNEQLTLGNVTFFQPRLDDFTDWRLLEELALTAKMGEYLSLAATLKIEHDHRPPAGVGPDDVAYTSGLKWAW